MAAQAMQVDLRRAQQDRAKVAQQFRVVAMPVHHGRYRRDGD